MPGYFNYKKGIVDPNKETVAWVNESPYADKLHLIKNQGVDAIKKEDNIFHLTSTKGEVFKAKHVVLCTGVMDVQPEINGSIDPILPFANIQLADYCLRCDGHHVLGKKLSVIGHDSGAAWVGIMMKERYNCPEVILLSNGKEFDHSDEVKKLIQKYDFQLNSQPITEVLGDAKNKQLDGYQLADGTKIETEFTFISLGMIVYNELAKSLGADLDARGFVLTDKFGESTVENLFVAGDLRANAKKQVYTAWDHAVDSVDKINVRIRLEKRNSI